MLTIALDDSLNDQSMFEAVDCHQFSFQTMAMTKKVVDLCPLCSRLQTGPEGWTTAAKLCWRD
jgi:hypothetical protein